MTPYVLQWMPEEDVVLFKKIRKIVQALPDIPLGGDHAVSCHILARSLARFFPVEYHDGYFCRRYRHSWLLTRNNHIIDPYPIAMFGGPVLLYYAPSVLSPWRQLYKEARLRDLELEGEMLLADVQRVVHALEEIMQKLCRAV